MRFDRVIHVTQPTSAGVAVCVRDLAAFQAKLGLHVTVACPNVGELPEWLAGLDLAHLTWDSERAVGTNVAREARQLKALLDSRAPDSRTLVHLHSSKAGLAGRLVLRSPENVIFQPHGWSFLAGSRLMNIAAAQWESLASRWAATIICVSKQEMQVGIDRRIRANYRVVPNGVLVPPLAETTETARVRARARLSLPDVPTAVCVGRVGRQKGQDILLKAWPQVRARCPDAHLVFVGDGEMRQALESQQVAGVTFVGWQSDVSSWLSASDVVVIPSRWEGMALVAIEAMAFGRSVVASDACGMRELLEASKMEAGAIVALNDLQGLGLAISKRLLEHDRAQLEGHRGRRAVEAGYTQQHWLEGMLNALQ